MRWRQHWARVPRPKVRQPTGDEQKRLTTQMVKEIARSPVLSAFGLQVRFLRGRFYIERPKADGVEAWGRITPVAKELLLERERRNWYEVAKGSAKEVRRMECVPNQAKREPIDRVGPSMARRAPVAGMVLKSRHGQSQLSRSPHSHSIVAGGFDEMS